MRTILSLSMLFVLLQFQDVKVSGTNGDYLVTGTAKGKYGPVYYTVEDGHVEFIKEKQVQLQEDGTFQLNIHIPREKLPHNATLILYLYEKNKKGEKNQPYPVVLERLN